MPGRFEIRKAKDGQFHFQLTAVNGKVILASEMYHLKAGAVNGIESVKKNAGLAERYDRLVSKDGKFYFTLKAGNNQVVGNSEMYESAAARENGIQSVVANAPDATIVENVDE